MSTALVPVVRCTTSYVAVLETLVEVFLVPLRTWAKEDEVASKGQAAKAGSVAPAEVETIFGSIETLLHVNRALLAELRAAKTVLECSVTQCTLEQIFIIMASKAKPVDQTALALPVDA